MSSLYNKSFGTARSLGYENPAFKISIVSPNDDLQQKQGIPRPNAADGYQDNLEVGSVVSAQVGKRNVVGKISRIFKNDENDTVFVEIVLNSGKKFKVDSTRIRDTNPALDNVPDNIATNLFANGIFAESRFYNFSEFSSTLL
jgi:hypothetical protein